MSASKMVDDAKDIAEKAESKGITHLQSIRIRVFSLT